MIKKTALYCFIFLFLIIGKKASAQELWFEYGLSYKTWNNLTTKVEIQHRFIDVGGLYNYKNCAEITLQYRLNSVFKLSGSYRFANQLNYSTMHEQEGEVGKQRYCVDLNARFPIKNDKFSIENRSRYQLALRNNEDVKRFYRNKTGLEIEIDKKTKVSFTDEIYYNITKQRLDLNRISMGINRELNKKLFVNLLFHIETDREGKSLSNNYIISSGLFVKL